MRTPRSLSLRLLLAAALLTPMTFSRVSSAELEVSEDQPNAEELVLELDDRKIIFELKDGASKDDLQEAADIFLEMVNGSPENTSGTKLSGSETAEQLIKDASANATNTLRIHVFRNTGLTLLATKLKKANAKGEQIIEIDLDDFDDADELFDKSVETRDTQGGTPKAPKPEVVALAKRLLKIEVLAHELRHADRISPDPPVSRTPIDSPAPAVDADKGRAVEAANDVVSESLEGTGLEHTRIQYIYIQKNSELAFPLVYDLEITVLADEEPCTQVITVLLLDPLKTLHDSQPEPGASEATPPANENTQQENVRPPPQTVDPLRNRRQSGCAASISLLDQLVEVPEVVTDQPVTGFGETGGGDTDGGDTDGGGTDTSDTDDGDTDDGDTDDGDTDDGDTDDGGGNPTACSPNTAPFRGEFIPQAGVEIDFAAQQCSAVTGAPVGDQMVIDDFGGSFGGSGTGAGLIVLDMIGGTFSNENGFYLLNDLEVNTTISILFQDDAGNTFIVDFVIDTTGASPQLTDMNVTFNAPA